MPEKSEPAAESEESRGKVENQLTKKIKAQDDPRYAKYFKMLRLVTALIFIYLFIHFFEEYC